MGDITQGGSGVIGGQPTGVTLFNSSLTSVDPTLVFLETFDGVAFDTNKWIVGGTVPPTLPGTGVALVNPGTAASASSFLQSVPVFPPSGYEIIGAFFQIETGTVATGNHRVLNGIYTHPTVWTALAPVQDGYVLEIDTLGVLRASVYSAGVRIFSQVITYPFNDGNPHLSILHYRPGIAAFSIDQQLSYVAQTFASPSVQNLPYGIHSINAVAGSTGTPTLSSNDVGIGDYSRPASANTDGTYPFRRQTVGVRGDAIMSLMDGNKSTYSAVATAVAAVAGDTVVLTGSATKTIRVTRAEVSGVATAASEIICQAVKRTAADTGGTTGTAPTIIAHDSGDSAASATIALYTAAPTAGAGAVVRTRKIFVNTAGATVAGDQIAWDFGNGPKRGIVLRGVAQQFAVSFGSAPAGGSFEVSVEWTEE